MSTTHGKKNLIFFLPCTKSKFGQKALFFVGVKTWQSLPIALNQINHLHSFSKAVKQNIMNKY